MSLSRRLSPFVACALLGLSGAVASAQSAAHLVISQVYGGGGATTGSPTYTTDYIELFNPTSSPISTTGLSVQYGAATTASPAAYSGVTALGSLTIQPGHYLLVGESSSSVGGALPTADVTGSIAMSATAGRVALVTGTAAVNCSSTAIIDRVGYGAVTTAACYESSPTAVLSNTTSATRTTPCTDSDNNAGDFAVVVPVAHNSTSASPSCFGGSTSTFAITSSAANPSSVAQGGSTTFTVIVSPATNSGTISVVADLSQIGGSKTQALAANGANTFTYTYTVPTATATSTYTLPVTATDATNTTANNSITLGVTQAVGMITPIATLQSNRGTYAGTTVTTQGVVTAIAPAGWFMQTPGATTPGNGLYVYAGSGKVPTNVVAGSVVTVSGSLSLYPATTDSHAPALELGSPTVSTVTAGSVPAPIVLPAGFPASGAPLTALQGYESMLVTFPSLTTTSGTGGSLSEAAETETSTGVFYAVATGVARPFRKPGIDFRDLPYATCPTFANCTATTTTTGLTVPSAAGLYNDSDERIIVDSDYLGGSPLDISAGAVITNVTGIIDYSYSSDSYYDPARFLPLSTAITSSNVTPGITVQAVPAGAAGQITVAAYNVERFFNTSATDNKYYIPATNSVATSSAVNVTAAAYARRLQKVSLAIRTVLNSPDIISLEEVENLSVVNDIAAQIVKDGGPQYVGYGTDSVSTFTNDVGGISVGFLVKASTVDVKKWEQIGQNDFYTNSAGTVQTVNDRPSQVLHVGIKRNGSTNGEYPLTVIANHLRSLSGIGDASDAVRVKKEKQAETIATAIQGYQTNGEHVIWMGDFNVFEFSDGYTDAIGTLTGHPAASNANVQPGAAILNPAGTDMALTLPAAQRQSYNEDGVAQILDHIVVTSDLVSSSSLQYAHLDADFPLSAYNDATTPARTSDHDAAVLYLNLPAAATDSVTVPNQNFTPGAATTTLSATVNYTGTTPPGVVAFLVDNTNPLNSTCKVSVDHTSLACAIDYPTASLSATTHTLTVGTVADSNYGAVSASATLTPGASKPKVGISVPAQTVARGANGTVSAIGTFNAGVYPMGTTYVTIDGANPTNMACSLTSNASAVCSITAPTSGLAVGPHVLTVYNTGDANYSTNSGTGVLTVR